MKYCIILGCLTSVLCQGQKLTREQRIHNGVLMRRLLVADFDEKLTLADKILKSDSNNTKALYYKAISEYRVDRQASYKDFERYFKKRPSSYGNVHMAEINMERGDTQAAVKNIEQALKFKTWDILVCEKMSKLFGTKKQYQHLWEIAAANNADNFIAWAAMGIRFEKLGNMKHAYECYTKSEKALDNQLDLKYRIDHRWIHILKAESAYNLKKYDEAVKAISTSILLHPGDWRDYKTRVKYFLAMGDIKNACRDEFQLAAVGEHYIPKRGELLCNYKDQNSKTDSVWLRQVEAEKQFIEASKIRWGDSTAQKLRLIAYLKVTDIYPTHVYALAQQAKSYIQLNAIPTAAHLYDEIIQIDPTKHQAWNELACCQKEMGFFNEALKNSTQAIQLDSTESQYWVTRATIRILLHDSTGAEDDLKIAVNLNSTNSVAFFNRGVLFMQRGKYQPALNDFLKAIDIEEDQPLSITFGKYHNNAAMAYKMLKQYDKAIEYIDIAIGTEPKNPGYYFRSGEIKAMMKDMNGACEDWHIAKKLGYKDAEEVLYYNCNGEKR